MRLIAVALVAVVGFISCSTSDDAPKTARPQPTTAAPSPAPPAVESPAAEAPPQGAVAVPSGTVAPAVPASPEAAASPSPAASPSASPEPTEEEKRAELANGLQTQIDNEVKSIAFTRAQIDKAQLELNDLTNLTFGGRRKNLIEEIEKAQRRIAESEEKIAKLQEDARRAGVRVTRP
jgi:hypothetical protein